MISIRCHQPINLAFLVKAETGSAAVWMPRGKGNHLPVEPYSVRLYSRAPMWDPRFGHLPAARVRESAERLSWVRVTADAGRARRALESAREPAGSVFVAICDVLHADGYRLTSKGWEHGSR